MLKFLRSFARRLQADRGSSTVPSSAAMPIDPYHDIAANDLAAIQRVSPYTMTSVERCYHLVQSIRYVQRHGIPGDIVECGVWRGGSMMLAAETLRGLGSEERSLFLYDTFEGMPPPREDDVHPSGATASTVLAADAAHKEGSHVWAIAGEQEVRMNLESTGYPTERLHFVRGRVEETIPQIAPERIALLRLDTDWYASTAHELQHLYPRVSPGGVVIIDDYGWWRGARKAVDEFLADCADPILLHRLDVGGGRAFVKPVAAR
jgi:O-methyltransferase